ncbi:MAG TPA: hypothetical protein VFQ81_07180 [Candidatus Limnocylindria bacterium]|nr:hypothetical protein [Candidatus Limnocylindria bacterium]
MRALVALLAVVVASGCTSTPSPSLTDATATAVPSGGIVNVAIRRLTDARPVRREAAMIGIAFDAATARTLVADPAPLDFASEALLCLALGERATSGWSVTIQSISLDGSRMSILAREARPRTGGPSAGPTYPADCAAIDRSVLSPGELLVRADDTISDEFIVDATIEVPAS